VNPATAFSLAWRVVPHLPQPVTRGAARLGADLLWWRRAGGVPQLEKNLARLRPEADQREIRTLSREALRSYAAYYVEAFTLRGLTPFEIERRVVWVGTEDLRDELEGGSVVLALGHLGNWDLAGAAACRTFGTVLTVAEVLEPRELFEEFLAFREGLGLEIVPLTKGSSVFRELLRRARAQTRLVPLLADRDLTRHGIEVQLAGHPARVAAGPAALALQLGRPLRFVGIRHIRVPAPTRWRPNRTTWGIEARFTAPLCVPDGPDAVARLTQAWVDELTAYLREYPTSWNMLQKVFVADLDPARLNKAANQ